MDKSLQVKDWKLHSLLSNARRYLRCKAANKCVNVREWVEVVASNNDI